VGSRIVLGVTGSIAAYKAADLARRLGERSCHVTPVLTGSAQKFITPLLLEAVTGNTPITDLWSRPMAHIELASADAVVVAPATANILGKTAAGIGDEILSTMLLAAGGPLIFAPAMNWRMYRNPAVQRNIEILKERGAVIVPPETGSLACGDEGEGRLAAVEDIVFYVRRALSAGYLSGYRVVVSSGPTREALDPVRFLSNRSSGKMGRALAEEAAVQGASVTLVSGPVSVPPPPGVETVTVETAEEMSREIRDRAAGCDVLIMAAAVADYRPAAVADEKISRAGVRRLDLEPTDDILAALPAEGPPGYRVGFAAEVGPQLDRAKEKMRRKNLDLMVFNDITAPDAGFEKDTNVVTLLGPEGPRYSVGPLPKTEVAARIIEEVSRDLVRGADDKKG